MRKVIQHGLLLYLVVFGNGLFADSDQLSKLLSEINSSQEHSINSGAVILLVDKNNVLVNVHIGKADWNDKYPLTKKNLFRVGSISKSFAALLAMRLQEADKLNIESPFKNYVKAPLINNIYTNTNITIEQLMEHTAGLVGLTAAEWDYDESDELKLEQSLLLKKGDHETHWQPGLHHSYTNAGYGLLGLALEKATGKNYEALMEEYVFAPLEMQSSTLLLNEKTKQRLITGYDKDGQTKIPYWHNIYRPFAAMNTNAHDMIQFLQMLLNDGKVGDNTFLTRESINRIETPKTSLSAVDRLSYGYALANYSWQQNGHILRGHGGDADGYLSRYGYNRESGLAYFVMVNAFNYKPIGKLRRILENYIIKDLTRQNPQTITLSVKAMTEYIGDYVSVTRRFVGNKKKNRIKNLSVYEKNGKLYMKRSGEDAFRFYPVTKNHFRYSEEMVATFAFVKHKGVLYLQGDMGNYRKVN